MIDALAESVKPRIGGDKSSLEEFQAILSKGLKGVGAKKDTEFKYFLTTFRPFKTVLHIGLLNLKQISQCFQ